MRTTKVRLTALQIVTNWFERQGAALEWEQVLQLARDTVAYLTGPSVVCIRVGLVTNQTTGEVVNPQPQPPGDAMAQLHDDEQVTVSIVALDAKGYQVNSVDFSASIDNDQVASVTDLGNDFLIVAELPGSATITFTDGTLTANLAVDVVPGDIATVQVQVGTPEKQPAPDAGGGDTGEVAPPVDTGVPPADTGEVVPPADGETPPVEVPPADVPPTDTGEVPPAEAAPPADNPVG